MHLRPALNLPVFEHLRETARSLQLNTYVIGGYVRDHLLGRECKDIDIVVEGKGTAFAAAFADRIGAKEFALFENFMTAMVRFDGYEIEFVGCRKESYRRDSRKPIVEEGTIQDDQIRRDFTINALSISLNEKNYGELIDPFGGLSDLKEGILRTPTDPQITFSDDPLRMLRAIRFSTQLGFHIEDTTYHAIAHNKERIKIVSKERITDELNKIIATPQPSKGFKLLFNTGLLHLIFPEMAALQGIEVINGMAHKDNFYHTLQVLDNLCATSEDLWLRWSAILHDIAKPPTKRFEPGHGWTFHGHEDKGARMVPGIFKRLALPLNDKMKFVQKMVKLHLRPIALVDDGVSDSAIRRLIFDAGDDLELLLLLCRADITTRDKRKMHKYLENFDRVEEKVKEVEERDSVRNWQPPVTGEMIMAEFNIGPSKVVGTIKNAIREAILEGEIPNEKEAAMEFMRKIAKELIP